MKLRGRPLGLTIIIGTVTAGLVFGAVKSGIFDKPKGGWKRPDAKPPTLQLLTLEETSHPIVVEVNGLVIPDVKVTVSAQRGGKVQEVFFRVGQKVSENVKLVQINDKIAGIDVEDKKAAARKADFEWLQAKKDLKRKKGLHPRVYSKEDIDLADLKVKTAKAEKDRADEGVNRAKQIKAEHLITSPISGVILKRSADKGNHVREGEAVAEILHLKRMKIEVGLTESRMLRVKEGYENKTLTVEGWARALKKKNFEKLDVDSVRISLEAVEKTRTFPVYIVIVNGTPGDLYPGMSIKLRIKTGLERSGLYIPASAVVTRSGKYFCWVKKDGKASLQEIDILERIKNQVRISGEVKAGEEVVVAGFEVLKDGQKLDAPKKKGPPHRANSH